MAKSIVEYGFFSAGASHYNYKFVFDIKKFSELFKKRVNHNLTVIRFEDFTIDFTGKVVLNHYLDEKSLDILSEIEQKIGILRKRLSPEKVEFIYVANFLGMKPEKIFYEKNKKLLDSLISNRINRNKALLVNIESAFKERFG
jgi:hypothetical protein